MKTPIIIAAVVLLGLAGLLFWDSGRHEPELPGAPAVPVSAPAPPPLTVTNVASDIDLRSLTEPPVVRAMLIETPQVTALGLAELARFGSLRSVHLNGVPLSDAGIAALKKARQINRLILSECGLTGEQAGSLAGCDNLLEFGLQRESLDAGALAAIGKMKQLRSLFLDGSSIDDQTLDYLQDLPNLTLLSLAQTGVTSEGIVKIEKFDHLKELNLAGTGVGKAALIHLSRMPQLLVLRLQFTHVGPACLDEMKRLKQVRVLQVSNNFGLHVLIELRQALPKTLVYNEGNGL